MDENQNILETILRERVEFSRNGMALLPDRGDKRPGIAYWVSGDRFTVAQRFCSCSKSSKRSCPHMRELSAAHARLQKDTGEGPFREAFRTSPWHLIANVLGDVHPETPQSVRVRFVSRSSQKKRVVRVSGSHGGELLAYLSEGPDLHRFLERCTAFSSEDSVPNRAAILDRLTLLSLTPQERAMMDRGFKTRGLVMEGSFWYRLAYHGFREFGPDGCSFYPAVEENTGDFTIECRKGRDETILRMFIPRPKVKPLIDAFRERQPEWRQFSIHPIPLKSIFKVGVNTELDLEVLPVIRLIQENGEQRFFEREYLERYRYGNLIYVRELGILAELERPGRLERKFRAPIKMVLKKSQVPSFLEEFGEDLGSEGHVVEESLSALRIYKEIDRFEIAPEAMDRDWCWLSVKYGFGNEAVSLSELLSAKKEGRRYVGLPGGWVDCEALETGPVGPLLNRLVSTESLSGKGGMKISRLDLFRLTTAVDQPPTLAGEEDRVLLLKGMLSLRPAAPLPKLKGMTSVLRPYQERGAEWLRFLFENGFGGILCDDMGLGKTHQVLAFLLGLREETLAAAPFLVVCPTTVMSHWRNKIRDHAPGLKAFLYYGGERDLGEGRESDILLTSYGILRKDVEKLKEIHFAVAVFDEIHVIKNPVTLAYDAAAEIKASMKLGLTGTPVENRLKELKALMDLTVPHYLGSDREFESRYETPIQADQENPARKELIRLISPFTLRRLKKTVLQELPEKIEDLRTCRLSDDQVRLYRDAVSKRGGELVSALRNANEPVPYLHIFSLLNLLKQICDHPALVAGEENGRYDRYESGKWDLFKELLGEGLSSGQKVVVYSQYLGMIRMMEEYLKDEGVGFVSLTGKSRNRGELIARFNGDPACLVYVGSLKAGGMGIDLVAASVVIHYDRWWNAAREDQATDRVHRIGQKRGVHVFKLVTEGTLEEKIAAVIEKKRKLMENVVQEDDPGLLKTFTRDELADLLSVPLS
jgi:superfamily II DNA or RNA helicase